LFLRLPLLSLQMGLLSLSYADAAKQAPIQPTTRPFTRRYTEFLKSRQEWLKHRCFRCGESGHRAVVCRNSRIYFICHQTGHISYRCPFNPKVSSRTRVTDSSSSPPNPQLFHTLMGSPQISLVSPPILHRIALEEETDIDFSHEFNHSVLLQASTSTTPSELHANLRLCHPGPWVVRIVGDNWFLIQGPDSWRSVVISHGFTLLGAYRFIVFMNLSRLRGQSIPEWFWIKVL
jgi:Zinc knuckle